MPTTEKPKGWDVRVSSLRKRLQKEHCIEPFEELVSRLLSTGMSQFDAIAIANQYYPVQSKTNASIVGGIELADPRIGDPELRRMASQVIEDPSQPAAPADVEDGDSTPAPPKPEPTETTDGDQVPVVPPSQPRPAKPLPAPPVKNDGSKPSQAVAKDDHLFARDPRWKRLIDQVPIHKTAPERVIIAWVFNNVANPIESIDPSSVPCRGALALLIFARSSSNGYSDLLAMWQKTLPTQSQLRADARFNDDGRTQDKLLGDFMESLSDEPTDRFDETGPEGPGD